MADTITSVSLGRGGGEDCARAIAPQLVLVLCSDDPRLPSSRHVLDDIDLVRFGRGSRGTERARIGPMRQLTVRVPDRFMSTEHGTLRRVDGRWLLQDTDSKNGCVVNGALTRRTILADGDLIEVGHTFFRFGLRSVPPGPADVLVDELGAPLPALATFDVDLQRAFASVARVAPTTVSVVLRGETGTGKEVVARALHELSGRTGPFVAVNCGALPDMLVEAELFGYRKGAFSGALTDRTGLVRSADRGTLFLDEFAELPATSQAAFLRVLQEQEVVPVGDVKPIRVDARLCAATLCDVERLVEAGAFRPDLHARLLGLAVELPPLRRRREDMGTIISALLGRIPGGRDVRFTTAAARTLLLHDWPFNVRELDKCLSTAVALCDGAIRLEHLPPAIRGDRAGASRPGPIPAKAPSLTAAERELHDRMTELLGRHDGNIAAVGRELGKDRAQIHRWVKRLGIDLGWFRARR